MARRNDLDLVLHLGDYIYEYGNGEYGDGTDLGGATRQIGRSLPLPIIENAMLSIEQMQICKNCTDSIPW